MQIMNIELIFRIHCSRMIRGKKKRERESKSDTERKRETDRQTGRVTIFKELNFISTIHCTNSPF